MEEAEDGGSLWGLGPAVTRGPSDGQKGHQHSRLWRSRRGACGWGSGREEGREVCLSRRVCR